MRLFLLFLLIGVISCGSLSEKALRRQKRGYGGRANVQGCTVTPAGIENVLTPAKDNTVIEFQCNIDTEFTFCQFQHLNPMDVGRGGSTSYNDNEIDCNIAGGDTQQKTCPDDSRITLTSSLTTCGLRISNPTPDDTGKWTLITGEVKGTTVQSSSKVGICLCMREYLQRIFSRSLKSSHTTRVSLFCKRKGLKMRSPATMRSGTTMMRGETGGGTALVGMRGWSSDATHSLADLCLK